MESYGALLRKARENKNVDIATVERDTTISRLYIEALENEDSSVFPGEPYLYGFLHNYAEYLGLDADNVAVLYKNKKIQEAPIPEGLYEKHRSGFAVPLIIAGGVLFLAAVISLMVLFSFSRKKSDNSGSVALSKTLGIHTYTLSDKPLEQRLYKGDQITVQDGKKNIILTVSGTLSTFSLDTPVGRQVIDLAEEVELDIDGDAQPELIVYVSDISSVNEDRGAEVKLMLKKAAPVSSKPAVAEPAPVKKAAVPQNQNIIFTDNRAYPFTINVTFRGSCEFRSSVDNGETTENYYASGEVVSMTPHNGVRLWMSNSNAVKIQIIANGQTYSLDTGKNGFVVVEDIKWIKDSDGLYKVVVSEVD